MTTRPSIVPARMREKMSLMFSSRSVLYVALTLPSTHLRLLWMAWWCDPVCRVVLDCAVVKYRTEPDRTRRVFTRAKYSGFERETLKMCRNIRTLHNFEPPATDEEIRASALQFVRKLSGFTRPSKANEAAFARAVDDVSAVARKLLDDLVSNGAPRDRETEAIKARARAAKRYA
jgi:hypothetical protein